MSHIVVGLFLLNLVNHFFVPVLVFPERLSFLVFSDVSTPDLYILYTNNTLLIRFEYILPERRCAYGVAFGPSDSLCIHGIFQERALKMIALRAKLLVKISR